MNDSYIPLSIPQLSGREWAYVKECLDSGWISSAGPFVERFERAFAGVAGAEHAVGVVNGTSALHVALLVAGVKPGDEVLVSNLTFISPVNAIHYCGAHPVLIDASEKNWQIDADKIEQFLAEECEEKNGSLFNRKTDRRVAAILPVHLLGLACEIDRICAIAQRFGLKVVEDAAEGMGVRYKKKHIGTFGDLAAFSFNGNKVMTAGGGGMIVARAKKDADYARYLTNQAKDDSLEFIHHEVGFNYRLTNLHAAIGVAQLEQLPQFLEKKLSIASYYKEALQNEPELTFMPSPADCEPAFWLYTVLLRPSVTLEQRREFIRRMNEQGIGARPFWHTIHDSRPYAGAQNYRIEISPQLYARGICLPSGVGLTPAQLERTTGVFKNVHRLLR